MTAAPKAAIRRWFAGRRLVAQVIWLTGWLALGLAALTYLLAPGWPAAFGPVGLAAAAGAGAAVSGWVVAAFVRRTTHGLAELDRAAQSMRREVLPSAALVPLLESNADLRALTLSLRRTVEAVVQRQQAMQAANVALGNKLDTRTNELSTLQDLSIGLASHSELNDLVDDALGALEKTVAYSTASVWAREGLEADGDVVLMGYRGAQVSRPGDAVLANQNDLTGQRLSRANLERYEQIEKEPAAVIENDARQSLLSWLWALLVDDASTSALYRNTRSWMAVPLRFHDQVMGVMRIDHHEPGFFDTERARLLSAVGSQAALAMRHTQLQAQGRELAVLSERQRIARDLHDAVSQTLFASQVLAGTLVQSLRRSPSPEPPVLLNQVESLERLNRAALAEMRLLMYELRPDAISNVPLADVLQHTIDTMTTRGDLVVEHHLSRDVGLPPLLRLHLYRIAQEALSNLVRHSGATRATVEWAVQTPESATLRIVDNGIGFDPTTRLPGHFGLDNMGSRAEEIGATLTITSSPGHGTEVLIQLGSRLS